MSNSITPLPIKAAPQAALAASVQALAVPAVVYGISGYNSKASAQFIQLHDSAAAAADGVAPAFNMTVGASSNFNFDFGAHGMPFLAGVYACNSSTSATKTIGSADCQFFLRLTPV